MAGGKIIIGFYYAGGGTLEKYAFFLDIDGTLCVHGEIPLINRLAIAKARQSGHFVFVNTGRSYGILPPVVHTVEFDGFVTSLGSSVIVRGEYVECGSMDMHEVAELLEMFNKKKYGIIFEGENTVWRNQYLGRTEYPVVKNGAELLEKFGDEIISKLYLPVMLDEETFNYINERYTLCQHKEYAEFTTKGHTKATGMLAAAQRVGVPRERCVAVGDSVNDEDMLRAAGIAVAMGDGDGHLKDISDIVTCDAEDGGVAEAIFKIIRQ